MLVAKKSAQQWQQQNRRHTNVYTNINRQASAQQVVWKLKLLAGVLVCALAAIAVISHYTQVVHVTRQVELATTQLNSLREESNHLKLEVASLSTPERLEKRAYEMGMQYPGRDQLIILSSGAAAGANAAALEN